MRVVPNDVYLRTRDALATLVSERAATRVLDAALRRASVSPDGLDERAVRKLLLGPVQRELEGILPRAGLRRTLRRLARQVADGAAGRPVRAEAPAPHPEARQDPDPAPAPEAMRRADPAPEPEPPRRSHPAARTPPPDDPAAASGEREPRAWEEAWRVDDRADPPLALAAVGAPSEGGSHRARASAGAADERGRPAQAVPGRAATPLEPTVVPEPLAPEALDGIGVRFAEIEGVTQVVGVPDRKGEPQARGEGLDPEGLARLARSAIRLLGRHGPLRSLVVEHAAGLLFIFPLGRDAVAVLARPDVNMGAVFAARAALEEAQ